MELTAKTWTEEETYLNVEERDHKSASEKDSKPSLKFVQQNDLLEKWMRWQTFQLSLLWARVQLSLWSSGADKTKEITDSAVPVPEWILLNVRENQNIFQIKIDISFEFSFACFMNEGPRKYCHIDCIAKWLSFKWLMNVAWTALWLLGTVVTIIEILKKNYEPYKRNNYYSLRSK